MARRRVRRPLRRSSARAYDPGRIADNAQVLLEPLGFAQRVLVTRELADQPGRPGAPPRSVDASRRLGCGDRVGDGAAPVEQLCAEQRLGRDGKLGRRRPLERRPHPRRAPPRRRRARPPRASSRRRRRRRRASSGHRDPCRSTAGAVSTSGTNARLEAGIGEREMDRGHDDPRVERIGLHPLPRLEARIRLLEQLDRAARDGDRAQREPRANHEPVEVARLPVRDRLEAGRDRGVPVAKRQNAPRRGCSPPTPAPRRARARARSRPPRRSRQRDGGVVVPIVGGADSEELATRSQRPRSTAMRASSSKSVESSGPPRPSTCARRSGRLELQRPNPRAPRRSPARARRRRAPPRSRPAR